MEMKVVILAGGLGTRLQESTPPKPKPMVEIGGQPILWHIMMAFSCYGFREFIIAVGYRGDIIKDFFLNFYYLRNDLSIRLSDGQVKVHNPRQEDWLVHLIDTGLNSETGGRIKRLLPWIGNETFLMTYGDGVADINLHELVAFHRRTGKIATVTAVAAPARFGAIHLDGELVTRFTEKPAPGEGWINGGFFVLEPAIGDYIDGDYTAFERQPLERLAREGQLAAYRHTGFWQCMDTPRDLRLLEDLWQRGEAKWKVWE